LVFKNKKEWGFQNKAHMCKKCTKATPASKKILVLRKFVFVFPQTVRHLSQERYNLSQERYNLSHLSHLSHLSLLSFLSFLRKRCSQKARERRRKRSASLRSLLLSLSQWEIFSARVSSSFSSSSAKTRTPTSSFGFRPLKKKRFWRDKK